MAALLHAGLPERYALGSSAHEHERLQRQADIFRPATTQLLRNAGLAPGMRVLDVGTGTGILAIASAVLGAAAVDAVDIEPEAVRVARANAVHNGVGNRVRVARGSVGAGQPFQDEYDLVVANILGPILITLADDLTRAVRRGGGLILGGIIDFREVSVRDAFQALGMQITRREELDGWVMLVLRKPDPGSAPANS